MIPILEGIRPFARRALRDRQPRHVVTLSILGTLAGAVILFWLDRASEAHLPLWKLLTFMDIGCLAVVAAVGLLAAPAIAGAAMAQELRTGTIDQLRMTPLGALSLALGVTIGSPAVAYLIAAGPAAAHLGLALLGIVPVGTALLSLLLLGMGSLAAGLFCAALPLVVPRQRVSAGLAGLSVVLMMALNMIGFVMALSNESAPWAYLSPLGALNALYVADVPYWTREVFEGMSSHRLPAGWFGFLPLGSLVSSALLAGFGALTAVRQISDPEQPALGRRHAFWGFTLATLSVTLPLWLHRGAIFSCEQCGASRNDAAMILAYFALPLLFVFVALATPSRKDWLAALRGVPTRNDGRPGYSAALLMTLGLLAQLAVLVMGGAGLSLWAHGSAPLGPQIMWLWLLLTGITGTQVLRLVVRSAGARVLVLVGLFSAAIGLVACLVYLAEAGYAYRGETGAMALLLGLLPAGLYLVERRAARGYLPPKRR